MTAINISRNAQAQLQIAQWIRNGKAPVAELQNKLADLLGYLGGGWWYAKCTQGKVTDWPRFWWGETALTAAVCVFFALAYRGRVKSE